MYSPDLTLSLGNLAYALSTLDKNQQQEDIQTLQALLASDSRGILAPFAYLLRKSLKQSTEQTTDWEISSTGNPGWEVNEQTKKQFIKVLLRAARAKEGISRREQVFLQAFWRQLSPR